jgi:hypothetical protein
MQIVGILNLLRAHIRKVNRGFIAFGSNSDFMMGGGAESGRHFDVNFGSVYTVGNVKKKKKLHPTNIGIRF